MCGIASVWIFFIGLSGAAIVQLSYRDGLGLEKDLDYVEGPESVTFESGQKIKRIQIEILSDQYPELEEILTVRLDRYGDT